MQKSRLTLRALTEGAIFVALAQVISYLKLFELPQGGSITVAMLPIFLYCARWGFGPGMLASFVYSVLQLLLDGGADVNKSRALNCAISQGKMEIAEMLLSEYGANPNVIDVSETPLAEALRKYPDNHALIEMLLAHGADPNLGVKGLYTDGCIPIVRAVYKGIRKNVQLLIDAGANVNVATATRCVAGWTPLIWLMHCQDDGICDNDNRLEIAQCLIGAGADVNARDKDGKTVLDHVPESSRLMRQLLEDNGAKKSTA